MGDRCASCACRAREASSRTLASHAEPFQTDSSGTGTQRRVPTKHMRMQIEQIRYTTGAEHALTEQGLRAHMYAVVADHAGAAALTVLSRSHGQLRQ
jgi:hypothetical protein